MNKWAEILLGVVLFNGVILLFSLPFGGFWNFGNATWEFLKGGVIWIVILMGFMFIALGISDLKENSNS